jgi:hypothetical protein
MGSRNLMYNSCVLFFDYIPTQMFHPKTDCVKKTIATIPE